MLETIEEIKIEDMIYEIRGKQVMLDSDLAKLYQCKNGTKNINLAVKRNLEKFPTDFCFQLNSQEYKNLKFQIETSKEKERGGVRKLPYAFTEQGIAMLATVIHTSVAAQISIQIMRTFVLMRKYISNNLIEQRYINNMVIEHDGEIKLIKETLEKLENKELVNEIYFEGQIYDAYSKIIDILNKANKEIIIVDRYADKSVLDIISKINIPVLLIVKKNGLLKNIDIEKYQKQYNNLNIIYDESYHDRYFILDRELVYHCGTSINYAGSKTFSINKIEDKVVRVSLINNIMKKYVTFL